ncbi:MAG: DUF6440 family protein [Ruminococcus flavefaciens]|nr:DUF6440 family protein [Ruminococcus flavefaciens]
MSLRGKKETRFIVKEAQKLGMGAVQVIVDTTTGVNYLNTVGGSSQGLTIMRDENDKIIVDDVSKISEE